MFAGLWERSPDLSRQCLASLSFARFAEPTRLFIVEDRVLAALDSDPASGVVPLGSLSADAAALNRLGASRRRSIPTGLLGARRLHRELLCDLRFCCLELLPYLRGEARASVDHSTGIRERMDILASLERRGADLPPDPGPPAFDPITGASLAALLGAPCVIHDDAVVPLERVDGPRSREAGIQVDGVWFEYRRRGAQSLRSVVRRLLQRVEPCGPSLEACLRELDHALFHFGPEVSALLHLERATDRGTYSIIAAGPQHELHYSRGRFLLVRGPVVHRSHQGPIYLGALIQGHSRAESLAVFPRKAASPPMFWSAPGVPGGTPICMGLSQQFAHLHAANWTDAEALVHWLDAAAIIAGGYSEFHRMWRRHRAGALVGARPRPCRPQIA